MLQVPVTRSLLPSTLAAVSELAVVAASIRHLPAALRAERASRLDRLVPSSGHHGGGQPRLPVLLVHGYLGTPACWGGVVPRLHGAGFADVFTFAYNALGSAIPELAEDLVRASHRAMDQTGAEGVHLVGHSLGGLISRYAVQHRGLAAAASTVTTIATPHVGARVASVAPGAVGAQMRPGSLLLSQLPPLSATPAVSWLVISSSHDLFVRQGPQDRHDRVAYRVLHGAGHQAILRSGDLAETVVRHLVAREGDLVQPPEPIVLGDAA